MSCQAALMEQRLRRQMVVSSFHVDLPTVNYVNGPVVASMVRRQSRRSGTQVVSECMWMQTVTESGMRRVAKSHTASSKSGWAFPSTWGCVQLKHLLILVGCLAASVFKMVFLGTVERFSVVSKQALRLHHYVHHTHHSSVR